jgi:hypothetical protein
VTAALNFPELEAEAAAVEPLVEVCAVVPPGSLGEGPLKLFYEAALKHAGVELGANDPFVVVITPSGGTPEHLRRAEDTAYQTSKALTAAGMTTFRHQEKHSAIMVYCFPVAAEPGLLAAEALRRMWAQLWQ